MMNYAKLCESLVSTPRTWLVTGGAGFIGSHLAEALLRLGQYVIALDNFSTGTQGNVSAIQACVSPAEWARFRLYAGDIRNPADCHAAMSLAKANNFPAVECVLHQAALCSVAESFEQPGLANAINVEGFLNIMKSAHEYGARKIIYASSSAVYGDTPVLPKAESQPVQPLSPYAITKYADELYADVYARAYGLDVVGLRYFNIFGPRQSPAGAYAAVIPKWIDAMRAGVPVHVYGDGESSRDFCHISNVVQANLLAACTDNCSSVYNIGTGAGTTLNQLYAVLRQNLLPYYPDIPARPVYVDARVGDIRVSLADIGKASRELGYLPEGHLGAQLQTLTRPHLSLIE